MIDVVMPQMGESIVEGTLTKWLKKPGEHVERDEPLFEISTDKVDTEIPSPAAGVLADVLVEEGKTVAINTIVARINEGAGGSASATAAAPPQESAAPQAATETSAAAQQKEMGRVPEPSGAGAYPSVPEPQPAPVAEQPSAEEPTGPLSPVVRKMAREHNIDLRQIRGTGAGG